MKTIVIRTADDAARVELVTDIPQNFTESVGRNFTVVAINGLSTAEANAGLNFKELAEDVARGVQYSIGYFKQFCIDNNFLMDIVGGGVTTAIVEAGDIDVFAISNTLVPKVGLNVGLAEVTTFNATADVAGSLNNEFFLVDTPENLYYVWFNINSAGLDPKTTAVAADVDYFVGRTGVEIAGATGATNATLGGAIKTALDALSDLVCTNVNEAVTLTNVTKKDMLGIHVQDPKTVLDTVATSVRGAEVVTDYSWTPTLVGTDRYSQKTYAVTVGALPTWASMDTKSGLIYGKLNYALYTIDGVEYEHDFTTNVNTTAADFDTTYSAALTAAGITVTANTATLSFVPADPTVEMDITFAKKSSVYGGTLTCEVTLTGTSGTANIYINGVAYLATFNTSLATTADNFDTTHSAALTTAGVDVSDAAGVLTFNPTAESLAVYVENLTGDLSATIVTKILVTSADETTNFTISATDAFGKTDTLACSLIVVK